MCTERNARYCKAKLPAARRGSALPNTAEPMPTPSWPPGPAINAMKATSPGRPIIAAKAISPNLRMAAAKAISPGPIPLAARKAISAGGPMADPEGISPSAAITAAEAFWAPPMLIAMWAAGSEASFPGTLMRADARDAMPPEFATRGAAFAHRRKGPPRFAPERRRARCFRDTPSLGLPSARASCRSREVFPVAQLRTSIRELGAPRRFRTLPALSTLVKRSQV